MLYREFLPLMRKSRLLVVERNDYYADLNGIVSFAERRNVISARVDPHISTVPYKVPVISVCIRILEIKDDLENMFVLQSPKCQE